MGTRINSLRFNNGTSVNLGNLVILVGPNNSGKSRTLAEIALPFTNMSNFGHRVLDDISYSLPASFDEMKDESDISVIGDTPQIHGLDTSLMQNRNASGGGRQALEQGLKAPTPHAQQLILRMLGFGLIVTLGTEQRLALSKNASSSNNPDAPNSLLDLLYRKKGAAEVKLNAAMETAFPDDVLRLNFSMRPDLTLHVGGREMLDISTDARDQIEQFAGTRKLHDEGDGFRSFVGICLALELTSRKVVLIDEPESFLHPPQALALGRYLRAQSADRQIIIATHSSDLVQALLSGDVTNTTVIRLVRKGPVNLPHVVESAALRDVSDDPLLGSTRSLEGMFYSGVVVCEGDSDRAVYQAASQRVFVDHDIYYTHAHGKQAINKVISAYRSLSVPCASIVDFDILNSRSVLKALLEAHGCAAAIQDEILREQDSIAKHVGATFNPDERCEEVTTILRDAVSQLETSTDPVEKKLSRAAALSDIVRHAKDPWKDAKDQGLRACLGTPIEDACRKILKLTSSIGIFIVPNGELESWLQTPGLPSQKNEWAVAVLNLIPKLNVDTGKDIWAFISSIHDQLGIAE